MSEAKRVVLRDLLITHYASLSQRLTRRLGSSENAKQALQNTYLRLQREPDIGPVRSPKDYLLRLALSIAADQRRGQRHKLTADAVDALLDVEDAAPARTAAELGALARAMRELPARRRAIFEAALIEKLSRGDLAKRFGVNIDTVDLEVQAALEAGARYLRHVTGKDSEV